VTDDHISKLQELIYELRVGDVIRQDVISVTPATDMTELREILRLKRISGTPVLRDGSLVGIITIEDLIRWLVDGGCSCTVGERMTPNVQTIHDDEPLIQAINKLERFGFGRLPVLRRSNGSVLSVITKGDIIEGTLRKLEIDYHEAEMRGARSRHLFEDIVADHSTLNLEYWTAGRDFTRAGTSASALKTTLRRLGMHPQTARRTAIVAYEGEMNLIVHTDGGRISVQIDPKALRLVVEDHGPGIKDIDKAMQAGFSTAPDWVRELGFGAGLGLNNIQNHADRMDLRSTVGKGTRLEVEIFLERENDVAGDTE
jgi:CBS domain-containing protein/anti-sigma regulatory factor (Ser/Thr protein kinase)